MHTQNRCILTAILAICLLCPAPSLLAAEPGEMQFSSVEERRIYQEIQEERDKLRADTKEVELRKKELKSLEESVDKKLAELDQKLNELQETQKKLQAILAEKSVEETQRTQELAKIYEKMTPQKAALAISGLEPQLAADLLGAMKAKSAAKILDQITKQKATELSTTFSTIQLE